MEIRVVVVGGANTDVVGRSLSAPVARDSNPGAVRVSPGGVGRNIAENLARLGIETQLVTAFGGDHNSVELMRHCRDAGVTIDGSIVCEDLPGPVYLAILDEAGEMELALSDMRALDRLTPAALEGAVESLRSAALVVCDANLSVESLEWLTTHCRCPVVVDPVSSAKAPRVRAVLGRLAALKCNAAEATAILETPAAGSEADPGVLAEELVRRGAGIVVVTDGAHGVHVATAEGRTRLRAPQVDVVNVTGAGDAFTAGFAAGMLDGADAGEAALWGSAMASLALMSEDTVSAQVSRETVERILEESR